MLYGTPKTFDPDPLKLKLLGGYVLWVATEFRV